MHTALTSPLERGLSGQSAGKGSEEVAGFLVLRLADPWDPRSGCGSCEPSLVPSLILGSQSQAWRWLGIQSPSLSWGLTQGHLLA